MRILKSLIFILLMTISTQSFSDIIEQETFASRWLRTKNYTIEVAKAMPEDKYAYRPVEKVMSFDEELKHMMENFGKLSNFMGENEGQEILDQLVDWESKDKTEKLKIVADCFDKVGAKWTKYSEDELNAIVPFFKKEIKMTRQGIFELMNDHIAHHRGRLTLMLSMNEIQSPNYVGW
ncbi:DinB family protein [Aureibacter tunicatorum]|uniref:Damage-inducible protein DinB n=1 Tax=Aureibacter tunicatorum TaxID=866807 RepID=A0AAE3XT20_9BACT|nr:DinB family protein [Aureibacter tunicatorum]MDR6241485.1 putative damage-inducible protein DinB [Aureibacter tunicatorum]